MCGASSLRPVPDATWTFDDDDDAVAFRRELAALWTAWLVAIGAVALASNLVVWLVGIAALGLVVFLLRPLQARAAAAVGDGDDSAEAKSRASDRDRALRQLVFGDDALRASQAGPAWLVTRWIVVVLTLAAAAFVLYDLLGSAG